MAKCPSCNETNTTAPTCSNCGRALPERSVGDVLGNYKITQLLGQGGMACVYEAEHQKLGRRDALKLLQRVYAGDPDRVSRFFAEARAANRVKHEGIIQIFDFVEGQNGDNYYVMEQLGGETLRAIIDREGRLPVARALGIAAKLAGALCAVHDTGMVHGDLKADNVFVDGRNDEKITVIDFGLTADVGAMPKTANGTPAYMAPETFEPRAAATTTDVYAFGVLFFELLVGRQPYHALDVAAWKAMHETALIPEAAKLATVPPVLSNLVSACLAKAPSDRPQDLGEVETLLLQAKASLTLEQSAIERAETPAPKRSPKPLVIAAVATALIAIVGGTVIALRPSPPPTPPQVAIEKPAEPPVAAPPVLTEAPRPAVAHKEAVSAPKKKSKKGKKKGADSGVIDAFAR